MLSLFKFVLIKSRNYSIACLMQQEKKLKSQIHLKWLSFTESTGWWHIINNYNYDRIKQNIRIDKTQ